MKRCTKCGIEKDETEFYINNGVLRSWCKKCLIEYNKKYTEAYCKSEEGRQNVRQYVSKYRKKEYACAKIFCKEVPVDKIVGCICKQCGKIYGYPLNKFNQRMNGDPRYYPKFCSRECQCASRHRVKSLYAKKIKELQKEYKCPTTS